MSQSPLFGLAIRDADDGQLGTNLQHSVRKHAEHNAI